MANAPASATYTNDPTNVVIDRVRLEIGDTSCSSAQLTDDEIRFAMAQEDPDDEGTESRILRAAARCARAIAAKMASSMDYSHGGVRKSAGQLFDHYRDLADDLDRQATVESVTPVVLGTTKAEKEEADGDSDQVQPAFKRGMHDNPRSGSTVLNDPNEVVSY